MLLHTNDMVFLMFISYFSFVDEESGLDMVADESLSAQRSLILYIDIYRIEQVIRNLITNAVGTVSDRSC